MCTICLKPHLAQFSNDLINCYYYNKSKPEPIATHKQRRYLIENYCTVSRSAGDSEDAQKLKIHSGSKQWCSNPYFRIQREKQSW